MSLPKLSLKMARCAASALLAAVEVYNKPTFEHREQTFAMLVVNAWEILVKARIVQQNNENISSIYRRQPASNRYVTHHITGESLTIALSFALSRISIPGNVRINLDGIIEIRNRATHLGILKGEASKQVLLFGAASVRNFITLYYAWFKESINIPYLLPVGFAGEANLVSRGYTKGQNELIRALSFLNNNADLGDTEHSVTLSVDINLNPIFSGGATVGITSDPSAPKVQISDAEFLREFPVSYREIVAECKQRYPNFKMDARFYGIMNSVKSNPTCSHQRRLDPRSNQPGRWFYNRTETLRILDAEYANE